MISGAWFHTNSLYKMKKGVSIMKSVFRKVALALSMMCIIAFASPMLAYGGSLDGISSGGSDGTDGTGSSGRDNSISDYLSDYNPVSSENMEAASKIAGPVANFIGTLSGVVIVIVSAGIFLVTAVDLLYIGIPFVRHYLNPLYMDAAAQPAGGAGGMGMGGMGMGGMGMGGMGMGGMGMGGMGMGMPSGGAAQAQPMSTKSVILMYLKKRMFFLIVFALATIILMSSIFTDCGINLAKLVTKIMEGLNGKIGSVDVNI